MDTRWKVFGLAAAGGIVLASFLMLRSRPAPIEASPPSVEVLGFAEFPELLEPFEGGTLQVRLVDLTSTDSAGLLIASASVNAAPRSKQQGWSLRVPAARARFAEDAYVIVTLSDHKGVRYIGSGFPRELTHLPRGLPNSWLGIKLAAVPAPAP